MTITEDLYRVIFIPPTEEEIKEFEDPNNFGPLDPPLGYRLMKIVDFGVEKLKVLSNDTYSDTNHSMTDLFTEEEINDINPGFMKFAVKAEERA